MMHAKQAAVVASAAVFLVLLSLPFIVVPTDAAAVLDTPETARLGIGTVLQIDARGTAQANVDEEVVRALTTMSLVFEITQKGQHGALFAVMSGSLVLNTTRFVVTNGIGVAGRPEMGRFNGTVVFVFRFNMTKTDGTIVQVTLRGIVVRSEGHGPILAMRGTMSVDNLSWVLRQFGRVHVVNK